jgi:signal transduction histidine kinase
LLRYNYDRDNFTRFIEPIKASNFGYHAFDRNGEIWFGTSGSGGLVSLDDKTGRFETYGQNKGMLHNDVVGFRGILVTDRKGRIWLPTEKGLSVFDPGTKTFINYTEKNGYIPTRFFSQAILSSNGDIWLATFNGLFRYNSGMEENKNSIPPQVHISGISILDSVYVDADGRIFKETVSFTSKIKLKYWQKDIGFDFVALHYLGPEDNLYSWKLENYDKDWSAPSKNRHASYTNLSPGTYTFSVKASNADGFWNEEGASITIVILPPWWKTWWAYILYALLAGTAIYTFIRWRTKALQKEKEVLEEKVTERTAELKTSLENLKATQSQLIQSEKMASLGELTAGIAHEIQNPLNFVNNFSDVNKELADELKAELTTGNMQLAKEIADDIKDNSEKINHHGKRADAIVKGMLQHSRSSNGQKEPTDINALCDEYLRLAYHGLRAKDKSFNATMKTDFDDTLDNINIIPQDIGRVILNLINNAFYAVDEKKKLNPNGYEPTVSVSTQKEKDKIEIRVRDNGNGIPQKILDKIFQPFFTTKPTGQGTGLGLSLSYDIVKAHGGELKVETKEGEGTTFTILLNMEK